MSNDSKLRKFKLDSNISTHFHFVRHLNYRYKIIELFIKSIDHDRLSYRANKWI